MAYKKYSPVFTESLKLSQDLRTAGKKIPQRKKLLTETQVHVNDVQKNIPPKVHTEVKKLENFYEAPEEEQHFLKKHPETYSPIDIKLLEEAGTFDMTF